MIHSEKYVTRIEDYNKNGELSLPAVLHMFENAGAHHSRSVDDDVIEGALKKVSWILTQWHVEIKRRPQNGEELFANTWAVDMKKSGLITVRNYIVKDKDDNICIQGAAKLVLMDLNSGKLLRIDHQMLEKYAPEPEDIIGNFAKTAEPREYDTELCFAVRRGDIDYNNHVHNTCYLDYALEAIPKDIYENGKFNSFDIIYKKPVLEGEKVVCKYKAEENGIHTVAIYAEDELRALVQLA